VRDFVFNGKLERLCGPLPPNDPNSLPCDQFPYTLDMEKAKALLAEAGYPDGGFTLEATVMEGDSAFRRTAEILQAQLAELNIQVNLTEMAWTTMWEQIGSLETAPDLIPIRNYPDYADSTSILSAQYNSAAWGSNGWNLAYYKNEEFDRLIEAANATTDEAERAELFAQMVKLVTDEAPVINVGTYVNQVAMRDNVTGYYFNPIYTPVLPVYAMGKD
jgi:peptide/nickel transport system substrate-binding protein